MAEKKTSDKDVVAFYDERIGRSGEIKVVHAKDVNGLETTQVRNLATGSLVAEVPAGEEQRLIDEAGSPDLAVTHKDVETPRTFVDDRGGVNEDVEVHTGEDAEKKLEEQRTEAEKNAPKSDSPDVEAELATKSPDQVDGAAPREAAPGGGTNNG